MGRGDGRKRRSYRSGALHSFVVLLQRALHSRLLFHRLGMQVAKGGLLLVICIALYVDMDYRTGNQRFCRGALLFLSSLLFYALPVAFVGQSTVLPGQKPAPRRVVPGLTALHKRFAGIGGYPRTFFPVFQERRVVATEAMRGVAQPPVATLALLLADLVLYVAAAAAWMVPLQFSVPYFLDNNNVLVFITVLVLCALTGHALAGVRTRHPPTRAIDRSPWTVLTHRESHGSERSSFAPARSSRTCRIPLSKPACTSSTSLC